MTITVLYFAAIRDLAGIAEEQLARPANVRTLADFQTYLPTVRPALAGKLAGVRFAINETFADPAEPVEDGDVVAIIPPVSGG
ncbi:MAG: molybdopterin converting factor subunit 1 [Polyangiaceae bacterium]|nr:molybdopterin converting factor subunit 1 [Polyangiaceae bacterium]